MHYESYKRRSRSRKVKELGVAIPALPPTEIDASEGTTDGAVDNAAKPASERCLPRGTYHGRGGRGKKGWGRPSGVRALMITTKSDKTKDWPVGSEGDKVLCWTWSWADYTKYSCPKFAPKT